jgi:hypothetical protein
MFGTKQSRTEAAVDEVREVAEQASEAAAVAQEHLEVARTAADQASDAAAATREKILAAKVAAAPLIQGAADTAKVRLTDVADRARPRVEAAQSTFVDAVLPKVGAALATATAAVAAGSQQAMGAAGPRLEHAKEAAYVAGDRGKGALAVLTGEAVAKRRSGRTKWLIGVGLAAAAVAAVAAFRKQQQKADDPWATPLEASTGTGTSSSGTSGSASLKDKAATQVEAAKGAVTDAAAKAKEKAGELASKGKAAVADAKDHSGEALEEGKDGAADTAQPAWDEAADGATEGFGGQVTAVDANPDSDAITSDAVEGGTINGASTTASPRGSAQARLAEEGDGAS